MGEDEGPTKEVESESQSEEQLLQEEEEEEEEQVVQEEEEVESEHSPDAPAETGSQPS